MTNRYRCLKENRRGFTLIEMVVVTAIIVIMAALIIPNMVAITESRNLNSQLSALQRMPSMARNEAAKRQQVVDLRIEGNYILMERTDPQTDQPVEITRMPITPQIQVEGAQVQVSGITNLQNTNAGSSDPASWKWSAYPDGTSDSGGLTFTVGPSRQQRSLYMPADSAPRWIPGALPQPADLAWTAGDIQQRTGTTTSTTPGAGAGTGGARAQ